MTFAEAERIALKLVEAANRIRDRQGGREVHDEFNILYGRLSRVVTALIPQERVEVRGHWKTTSVHNNYIEAGFMSGGVGVYEVQGHAQLMQLLGALQEGAEKHPNSEVVSSVTPLVNESRLEELRGTTSKQFDFSRLIRLCEELNASFENSCYHATAALTRMILDHVPPIFAMKTFAEVANNYAGPKSFKDAMQQLDGTARKIADAHLHVQIRRSESLPNDTQVNFSQGLDLLLSEIIRISK